MIWALHGFLGVASDWDFLLPREKVKAVDLYENQQNFQLWAKSFNQRVRESGAESNILLGYSLGGRLALHVFFDDPELWSKALFLSTHPGLKTEEEKEQRLQMDEVWAQRFLGDPWRDVMAGWNDQSVLSQGSSPQRSEENYEREKLAFCLRSWSLGLQDDFRPLIAEHREKITWLTGERDEKFSALAKEPSIQGHSLKDCHHRLLWEPSAQEWLRQELY